MNVGRIFGNAIARRVAYVLVALALAWMGLDDASAQTSCPQTAGNTCTQGVAYAACSMQAVSEMAGWTWANKRCTHEIVSSTWAVYSCYVDRTRTSDGAQNNNSGCQASNQFWYQRSRSCGAIPDQTFSSDARIPTGSVGCGNGGTGDKCEFMVTSNGDGTFTRNFDLANNGCNVIPDCPTGAGSGWYMHPGTGLCQPFEEECPANQTKNPSSGACEEACPTGTHADSGGVCQPDEDDCPAGNVRAPSGQCLPGDGQCAAGEARRPNGTCGVDSDGDGQADEDDEDPENDPDRETASGGDSCNAPPSCSGGPIDCLQAKIQWRIDCNTRHKVNVTGGACGAMPVCVGENCKAMEYAQLMQQWKAACALEKLANADGSGEGGDNADLIALLTGPGSINGEHGDTGGMPGGDGPFQWGEGEEHEPDTTGFGYGSSCPSPPSFTVGGRTISIDLTIM